MDNSAEVPYRRLPGRTPWFRLGGANSPGTTLWLGPDHVLKIERRVSQEKYKRFHYRDVQAVVVQETTRRSSLVLFNIAAIVVILLVTAATSSFSTVAVTTALLFAAPFLVSFVVNLVLGPTMDGVLVTAVGTEPLTCLSRMTSSTEALRLLADEVSKAQGELTTAELSTRWPAASAIAPTA